MEDKSAVTAKQEINIEEQKDKKTYHSPRFQVYGSLNSLTQAKPGNKGDGPKQGPPFTKF